MTTVRAYALGGSENHLINSTCFYGIKESTNSISIWINSLNYKHDAVMPTLTNVSRMRNEWRTPFPTPKYAKLSNQLGERARRRFVDAIIVLLRLYIIKRKLLRVSILCHTSSRYGADIGYSIHLVIWTPYIHFNYFKLYFAKVMRI